MRALFRPFKVIDLESTATIALFRLRAGGWEYEEKAGLERNSNFSELLQRRNNFREVQRRLGRDDGPEKEKRTNLLWYSHSTSITRSRNPITRRSEKIAGPG